MTVLVETPATVQDETEQHYLAKVLHYFSRPLIIQVPKNKAMMPLKNDQALECILLSTWKEYQDGKEPLVFGARLAAHDHEGEPLTGEIYYDILLHNQCATPEIAKEVKNAAITLLYRNRRKA